MVAYTAVALYYVFRLHGGCDRRQFLNTAAGWRFVDTTWKIRGDLEVRAPDARFFIMFNDARFFYYV